MGEGYNRIICGWTWALSLLSGLMNFLALQYIGRAVTHHTGNLTKLAQTLMAGENIVSFFVLLLFPVVYFLGAAVAGFLYTNKPGAVQTRYGAALCSIGIGMVAGAWLLGSRDAFGLLLSFMAGVQNGIYLRYRSVQLRSTHMTGYLTDAGFALSRWIKGEAEARERFVYLTVHLFSFFLGGIAALLMQPAGFLVSSLIAGAAYMALGLICFQLQLS